MTTRTEFVGLTTEAARARQQQYGKNELTAPKKTSLLGKLVHILAEPMFLLLLVAALIYFLLGEARDGAIMLIFVVSMIGIDVVQEWKTDKTLAALKELSAPQITVLRDGREQQILSVDLVPGDLMLLQEGSKIPADGSIIKCADLCVDESSLTGEAEGVWKKPRTREEISPAGEYWRQDYCYAGTLVIQGTALVEVERIGAASEYGKIGAGVSAAPQEATPLQKQTNQLVRTCALIAGILFILVGIFTWQDIPDHGFRDRLIESILSGVTLAMAMIPEEFPVILTVFLSMGAWRLARKKSLVRKLPSVETLGAVSVLCVDKTGTITMNQMTVQETWLPVGVEKLEFAQVLGRACESETYDPMEKAMLSWCESQGQTREQLFAQPLVYEYAFTNALKMMGHVWQRPEGLLLTMKGSPERVLPLCKLSAAAREKAQAQLQKMSEAGLRVIAVASASPDKAKPLPEQLSDYELELAGLIGLADPPRPGIEHDIALCNEAGIRVIMITGDNGVTAAAIAKKIGMTGSETLTGEMLSAMDDNQLQEAVRKVTIFSRVIPEHKMRIVRALQKNGAIVAMTGDGVNDAPALKYADIGIAMGKRGSEVSREAADLILLDDNFRTIVETVRDGRRIYDNICKAVGYVFTIHIPIAGASLLAPFLGIAPAALMLLPLHIVLLEILIDPTCSIVLERQPAESEIMSRPPRDPAAKILTPALLLKSVAQGITIFAASFGAYFYTLAGNEVHAPAARAMGVAVIMLANLFLVQVNSSEHDLVVTSLRRLAQDRVMWAVVGGTLILLTAIIYSPVAAYLKMAPLSLEQMAISCGLAFVSVAWYELVKIWHRGR